MSTASSLRLCAAPIWSLPCDEIRAAQIEKARDFANKLRRKGFNVSYDAAGSIGRRYRRMDEVGPPFCCCVGILKEEEDTVAVRLRDDPLRELPRIRREDMSAFLTERFELLVH